MGHKYHITTLADIKERCDRSQGHCDTDRRPSCRSLSGTTAEIKTAEVEEKPLIQTDEQEEGFPSRVKDTALIHLGVVWIMKVIQVMGNMETLQQLKNK